jgi:hypothetical protein
MMKARARPLATVTVNCLGSTKTDQRPRRLSTKDAEGGKVGDDWLELLGAVFAF